LQQRSGIEKDFVSKSTIISSRAQSLLSKLQQSNYHHNNMLTLIFSKFNFKMAHGLDHVENQ